ncbi:Protein of unknown function DUF707 [Dillenia turbinata]|uniref:Uncharacterized protein n=1 Tax=Dillenia turbinata TaxID=194707 RepID=A0AAN8YWC1_9MAGN
MENGFGILLLPISHVGWGTPAASYGNKLEPGFSMKPLQRWDSVFRKRQNVSDGGVLGKQGNKMKQLPFMGVVVCIGMLFIVYRTTKYQYHETEHSRRLDSLPLGIIQENSDLELKSLGLSRSKVNTSVRSNLIAITAGIKQKENVNAMVQKFLSENFAIVLFHYDGNVNEWWDLEWSSKAIHIAVQNQTKWWFAKRFLHPAVVSIYDYIFIWDEDLDVQHFDPKRYLEIVKSEGLEISQPALDPNSTDIHHRITVRNRFKKFHRRVYDLRGKKKCSEKSEGPPCTGWVEGMAPVFSRAAWYCAWHLIQNDLVHGWGMDMKLGYCAQGDRTEKVGVVDSVYIIHKGIQTLGGSSITKDSKDLSSDESLRKHDDVRIEIRRQATSELTIFRNRWEQAVKHDKDWVDPYKDRATYNMRRLIP